jgi:hypothetical protein
MKKGLGTRISFQTNAGQAKALREAADKREWNVSCAIRQAIREWLVNEGKRW